MATGILICEDSRFFQHDGFDAKAIQESIRNNLRAGTFVRGGSTVSMQLAKNLYLSRQKTLSRKLQEAVLTLLLEQSLTKEQILELYLNVIEFAPGVYGIGPAASYYFRSLAKDLSLGQSLYLASILPNPKNRHFALDGTLSDMWSEYLRKLMVIAHKIRRIDDHELATGLAETVHFGVAAEHDSAARDAGDEAPELAPPDDGYPSLEGP
jgi:membrane peptidoglycan carboxypeptidase